jgi:phosphohistidine phosphatase
MSRELLILRHAKSAWDTGAPTDFERPLAPRGLNAAPRVGRFLAAQGLRPDYVVSSPAERARQTVLLVCAEMGIEADSVHWESRIYGCGPRTLFRVLRDCPPDATRVLIAGHNPGLELLLVELCGQRIDIPPDGKLLPTAAVAHLAVDSEWAAIGEGAARLLSLTRARALKD